MKKNRLILLLSIGISLGLPLQAQSLADAMEDDSVTKQELEELLTEKAQEAPEAEPEEEPQGEKEVEEPVEEAARYEEVETTVEKPIETTIVTEITEKVGNEVSPAVQVIEEVAKEQKVVEKTAVESQPVAQPVSQVPATPEKSVEGKKEATEDKQVAQAEKPAETVASVTTDVSTSKPEPASTPAVEVKQEESLLDTIDIEEGGNWVLKRKALQDTVRKIEDINALYDDIRDTNVVFLQGINTVDVLFTQFTYDVGLDLGKVDQLVHDVAQHFEAEREETGDLSEEEREMLLKAQERKKEIEKLRINIYDIWQALSQLKEARGLNDEQIIEADRLRKQAWRNFRMIERVLNEEKAEELYHETVQLFETMQASYRYLQTRLIPHFEQSIKTVQDKMQLVKEQAEELQKQGVLLKKEAVEVDRKAQEAKEAVKEEQAPAQTGWFATIKSILWAPFKAIGGLWNWVTGSSSDMNQYLPEAQQAEQHKETEAQSPDEL